MSMTFQGIRTLSQIKRDCLKNGWGWDQSRHDSGSDYVTFGFQSGNKKLTVVYNTFNGRFIVKDGRKMVTEENSEMDKVRWYSELLNFIYITEAA